MRLTTLAAMALGAAAGYLGARALLSRESLPEQLPAAVRDPLERAGARLRRARTDAMEVLTEVEQTRASAERELTEDFLRRVGRSDDAGAPETAAEAVRRRLDPP
jgi:hypothetical protein